MGDAALAIEGLTKSYRGKRAVDGVDMVVPRGEIVGFLGPNGAGKTSVMAMAVGLIEPDAGRIEVLGVPGGARQRHLRTRVGYLQEKPCIYPEMSARAYLRLFAGLYGVPDAARLVDATLDRVGLAEAAHRELGSFSRGMQQRACLGRVMLHRPELLLLDEPTLGLDPQGVAELREIYRQVRAEGTTLLFSSHQLAEMEHICDRVVFLSAGRVVAEGRLDALLAGIGAGNGIEVEVHEPARLAQPRIAALPGVESVRETGPHRLVVVLRDAGPDPRDARAALVRAITSAGLTVLAATRSNPSLEDVYLALARSDARAPARNH